MMVLYGCLFYIFILILSTFEPNSITFTVYYYLPKKNTDTPPVVDAAQNGIGDDGLDERRGGSVE